LRAVRGTKYTIFTLPRKKKINTTKKKKLYSNHKYEQEDKFDGLNY